MVVEVEEGCCVLERLLSVGEFYIARAGSSIPPLQRVVSKFPQVNYYMIATMIHKLLRTSNEFIPIVFATVIVDYAKFVLQEPKCKRHFVTSNLSNFPKSSPS
jgi:hypothetical protein